MSRLVTVVCLIAALFAALFAAAPAFAEDRRALVIGNGGYRNVPGLANPVNDARLMTRTLEAAGFRVTMVLEADRAAMTRAVERFGNDLRAAPPGSLALFYYAGHGVRSDGFNFLLPIDADIGSEADIPREAIAAEWVLARIETPGVTKVMVLDACRNNPFDGSGPRAIPEIGDGLARMTARDGNLIAYATGPGAVALDGTGDNSPYTAALAGAIATPGLDVEEIFERVRVEVETATAGAQIPWESSALPGAVFLRPGLPEAAAAAPADDPAETPLLGLAVTFRPGRWGSGAHPGCATRYRYDAVSLPVPTGDARRVGAANGKGGVALELTASRGAEGVELTIVPVSPGASGRPIRALLADIPPGRELAVLSNSRHPDLFGCGNVTVHLSRD